jgi:hypothetical protein
METPRRIGPAVEAQQLHPFLLVAMTRAGPRPNRGRSGLIAALMLLRVCLGRQYICPGEKFFQNALGLFPKP